MKKRWFFTVILLSLFTWAKAQEESTASHTSIYNPQLKALLPTEVSETSGLFFHNGRLWTHNDSGGKPILYALDTTTFEVVNERQSNSR